MRRGLAVLACLCAIAGCAYYGVSKWGIRHETLNLYDNARQRPIPVDLAVRWDYEMRAKDLFWKLPVAIISNGNTVRNTEYSFLANVFAARGYLVASIQQDLPTDPPLVTRVGLPYVGRLAVYQKGEANIQFVLEALRKLKPNADYAHMTLVGHSNGGDTAMYFALQHPDQVSKVVTLDNLRVPFVLRGKLKILSFRSKDPHFMTDPGVLPTAKQAKEDDISIIKTQFQHTWMSDRGPEIAKERIQTTLDRFLEAGSVTELASAENNRQTFNNAAAVLP